jgi:predicted Zn-dependent peptidase
MEYKMKFVLLFLIALSPLLAQNKADDVKTFTLKNGMQIIVLEDQSIPNVAMYLFYKVGSRNEYPGITGISHFFEHMMFNGAKKYGPKQFDITMEANGGANNAYTSNDVTVYSNWFPRSAMDLIFDLEADRIGHLNFDDKMIESERGVILSERSTSLENSNETFLIQDVLATAFNAHPYMWPVIGWESDIKNWTKNDLQNYFKTYYAPNNCVVVLTGDVTLDEVKKLSKKYFEPIPQGNTPRKVHTVEPEQLGERRLRVKKDVTTPHVIAVYHVPEANSPDYYSLSLLNSILSAGNTSRLYSSLVDDKQIATEVWTNYGESFDPFVFMIYAICNENVTTDKIEEAFYEELDKIANDGITDNELQKVKNQKLMEFYRVMETINGKANQIGTYQLFFGDYKKLFNAPDEYQKVTADDIKNVVKKYFTKSNRTVGILQSEGEVK